MSLFTLQDFFINLLEPTTKGVSNAKMVEAEDRLNSIDKEEGYKEYCRVENIMRSYDEDTRLAVRRYIQELKEFHRKYPEYCEETTKVEEQLYDMLDRYNVPRLLLTKEEWYEQEVSLAEWGLRQLVDKNERATRAHERLQQILRLLP